MDICRYSTILDDNNNPILDDFGNEITAAFDAEGVNVGDAAQTQVDLALDMSQYRKHI